MNHLVVLDARAGELEKILSGVKTMLIKEIDPMQSSLESVHPGDTLYFLRNNEDYTVRVKATVARVLFISTCKEDDLVHALKEMQPRLHLTEAQYNHWSTKGQVLLVEFESAHKIDPFLIASLTVEDQTYWISFEKFRLKME